MRIIFSDFKRGEAKIKITSLDDLWYLSQIIDEKDIIKGETFRKIKVGSEESQKQIKRSVFLSIEVEKIEFHSHSDILRVSGVIVQGPDDVPRGTHHTFNVELNSTITILKKEWLSYQIDELKEANSESQPKILMVAFDREEAHFALANSYGYEYLSEIKGNVEKKGEDKKIEGNFYDDIMRQLKDYVSRYGIEKIIVASLSIWQDYLAKHTKDAELKGKMISATCSAVGKTCFNEILKRPEVEIALKQSRIVEEISLIDELLKEIMHNGLAKYGFDEVKGVAEQGAVRILLVTDKYMRDKKEQNEFSEVNSVMKSVDSMKGKIKIISSENEAGKKLDGLGGIAALLRYKA